MKKYKKLRKTATLSIVIVNWNTKEYLAKCLSSIYKNNFPTLLEVIVVDNASKDDSSEMVRKKYPWVKLIANKKNKGFAGGNNQGWKKSKGKYILFLNPDAMVHSNCLQIMVDFMEKNPQAGACSAKLVNPDGTDQKLGFYRITPTLVRAFFSHSPITPVILRIPYFRGKLFEHTDFSKVQEIDQPPGACFFTRRSVLKKIGAMDEDYTLYFEDVDLAYRIKQAGWKQYFLPNAIVVHFVGRSTIQLGHGKRSFLYYKSMIKFFKKFYSMNHVRLAGILVFTRFLYELVVLSILSVPRKISSGWGGKDIIQEQTEYLVMWIKIMLHDYEAI